MHCGECGSRLILTNARSRQGVIYPYFICAGHHSKRTNCQRKAMFVPDVETAVEDYYRHIQIPEHIIEALHHLIGIEFDRLHETSERRRGTYLAERQDLNDRRTKLLHAHLDDAVPLDLMKEEQNKIAQRIAFLDAQIQAGDIEYDQAKAHLVDCLKLAGDCHKLYMSIDDSPRRITNQAFFDKLYIQDDDHIDAQAQRTLHHPLRPGRATTGRYAESPANMKNDHPL